MSEEITNGRAEEFRAEGREQERLRIRKAQAAVVKHMKDEHSWTVEWIKGYNIIDRNVGKVIDDTTKKPKGR